MNVLIYTCSYAVKTCHCRIVTDTRLAVPRYVYVCLLRLRTHRLTSDSHPFYVHTWRRPDSDLIKSKFMCFHPVHTFTLQIPSVPLERKMIGIRPLAPCSVNPANWWISFPPFKWTKHRETTCLYTVCILSTHIFLFLSLFPYYFVLFWRSALSALSHSTLHTIFSFRTSLIGGLDLISHTCVSLVWLISLSRNPSVSTFILSSTVLHVLFSATLIFFHFSCYMIFIYWALVFVFWPSLLS